MKILYIGNFNDGTGWAKAGTYNALCLDAAGHDVYCQEIKYNNNYNCLDYRILELKEKKTDSFDVVIQHVLPTEYVKYPNVKNVGMLALETLTMNNLTWAKNIDLMDEIWFPNQNLVNQYKDYIKVVKKLPHSIDIEKIRKAELEFKPIPELQNSHNFIFVGENTARKNIEALVVAFYSEFNYYENTNLVIKTNKKLDLNEIWRKTRNQRSRRKNIFLIEGYQPESAIYNLMKHCFCFVMPSRGEAWCYPAMEAQALGLRTIYTKGIGIEEYCPYGIKVDSTVVQCYGEEDGVDGLYTCDDLWYEPSIKHLRECMRKAYIASVDMHAIMGTSVNYYDYRDTRKLEGLL